MPTQSVPTRRSSDLTPLQPPSPRSPRKPKPRKNRPAPKNPRTRTPPTAPDDQTTGTEPPSRWHRPLHHTHISGLASPKDHQAALFCRNAFAGADSAASSCSSPPPTQAKQHPSPGPPRIHTPILPRQPRQRPPVLHPQLPETPDRQSVV